MAEGFSVSASSAPNLDRLMLSRQPGAALLRVTFAASTALSRAFSRSVSCMSEAALENVGTLIEKQFITAERMAEIMAAFERSYNRTSPLLACASCGIREYTMAGGCVGNAVAHQWLSIDVLQKWRLTAEEIAQHYALGDRDRLGRSLFIERRDASVADRDQPHYYLYPQFVDIHKMQCILCPVCITAHHAGRLPELCLARGCDYVNIDAAGLPTLSIAEQYAIALERPYMTWVKLAAPSRAALDGIALSSHVITFPQNAVTDISKVLPNKDIEHKINVVFLGPRSQSEVHLQKGLPPSCRGVTRLNFANIMRCVSASLARCVHTFGISGGCTS